MRLERIFRIALAIPMEDAETNIFTYYKAFADRGDELVSVGNDVYV